jgi:hypothetical protein
MEAIKVKVKVEMHMDSAVFSRELDCHVVQLMMNADIITISSNSIEVTYKEVMDNGIVKFYGKRYKNN